MEVRLCACIPGKPGAGKAGGGGNGYPRDPESLFSLFEGGEVDLAKKVSASLRV